MGADIHCFIEYKRRDCWESFGREFPLPRDYDTFGRLAGVRGDEEPVVPPRGFPADAGWAAGFAYWYTLADEPLDCEGFCTPQQAAKWLASGASVRHPERLAVSDPDAHTATWLTTDEWAKATHDSGPEYGAVLAALGHFEGCGFPARVVFWFDN